MVIGFTQKGYKSNANFLALDLNQALPIKKQFDLISSWEVAKHLPSECVQILVESLAKPIAVILFSATVPFQKRKNRVNEQLSDCWAKLFQ